MYNSLSISAGPDSIHSSFGSDEPLSLTNPDLDANIGDASWEIAPDIESGATTRQLAGGGIPIPTDDMPVTETPRAEPWQNSQPIAKPDAYVPLSSLAIAQTTAPQLMESSLPVEDVEDPAQSEDNLPPVQAHKQDIGSLSPGDSELDTVAKDVPVRPAEETRDNLDAVLSPEATQEPQPQRIQLSDHSDHHGSSDVAPGQPGESSPDQGADASADNGGDIGPPDKSDGPSSNDDPRRRHAELVNGVFEQLASGGRVLPDAERASIESTLPMLEEWFTNFKGGVNRLEESAFSIDDGGTLVSMHLLSDEMPFRSLTLAIKTLSRTIELGMRYGNDSEAQRPAVPAIEERQLTSQSPSREYHLYRLGQFQLEGFRGVPTIYVGPTPSKQISSFDPELVQLGHDDGTIDFISTSSTQRFRAQFDDTGVLRVTQQTIHTIHDPDIQYLIDLRSELVRYVGLLDDATVAAGCESGAWQAAYLKGLREVSMKTRDNASRIPPEHINAMANAAQHIRDVIIYRPPALEPAIGAELPRGLSVIGQRLYFYFVALTEHGERGMLNG